MVDFREGPGPTWFKTSPRWAEYWLADPQRTLEAQHRLFAGFIDLWAPSARG